MALQYTTRHYMHPNRRSQHQTPTGWIARSPTGTHGIPTFASVLGFAYPCCHVGHQTQVLDGSDNFPTKYLVNDACEILGIPNVYGAILGFEGQMSVFTYKVGPFTLACVCVCVLTAKAALGGRPIGVA